MSFNSLLVSYFTPQTLSEMPDGGGGVTSAWANGIPFAGRLSILSASERLSADKITVFATHKLYCDGAEVIGETQRILFGTRIFEVKAIQNPSAISHHLELTLLEVY